MKTINSAPILAGYVYSSLEARLCRDAGKLLSIRIETSLKCDLNCIYCCNTSGAVSKNGPSLETLKDIVSQASELGARSVSLSVEVSRLFMRVFKL